MDGELASGWQLAPDTVGLLRLAAVIGRDFAMRELAALAGRAPREVLRSLTSAFDAQVLRRMDPLGARARFADASIHEAFYVDGDAARRAELHCRTGEVLEQIYADELEDHLAALAHHFFQGAVAGGAERALHYARRAGHAAVASHDLAAAVRHYEQGLAAWELVDHRDRIDWCALLVDLGWARQWAGDGSAARVVLLGAIAFARRAHYAGDHRAAELFARAALGLGHPWGAMGTFDLPLVHLLEEAAVLVPRPSPLRPRILARLAVAHCWSDARGVGERLSTDALALARRLGDEKSLGHALFARHFVLLAPDRMAERLATTNELMALAARADDPELELGARFWRYVDRLATGDLAAARQDVATYARLAEALRRPHFRALATIAQAMLATLDGRVADAEALALRALELGRCGHPENAEQYYAIQVMMVARLRGCEEAAVDAAHTFVDRAPRIPAWRAAVAALLATTGRTADAAREIRALGDPRALPRDANLLTACTLMAEVAAILDDRSAARALYETLRPFAAQSVIVANAAGHLGTVSHALGRLASVIGRADRADAWLADAQERYEAWQARPLLVRVLLDRAALAARTRARMRAQGPGDPFPAMVQRALAAARELGMARCVEEGEALAAILGAAASSAPSTSVEDEVVLRCEGPYWTLAFRGTVARLRDVKGLHYLKALLEAPGRDLHVLDLAAVLSPPGSEQRRRGIDARAVGLDGGDTGPLLDARAKEEYRRRIVELREELDAARGAADPGRCERARAEIEHLTRHLAASYGVGGRDRRASGVVERTRLNVTRAVRAVIGALMLVHPELARHLDTHVVTGRLCRYAQTSIRLPGRSDGATRRHRPTAD